MPTDYEEAVKATSTWHLGQTSEKYESSGRGAGLISTGRDDHGGVSYGVYQLSSNSGTLQEYLDQSTYGIHFQELSPATPAFDARWRELARIDPEFGRDQHAFIGHSHYEEQLTRLEAAGIGLRDRGKAVQDMLWSTSVQFRGLTTTIVSKGLDEKFPKAYILKDVSDRQIIEATQEYKIAHNNSLFRSSSGLWPGLLSRANAEKADLLELAEHEQNTLLSNHNNPHNFLYRQTLDRVHRMEVDRCIIPGPHSENLAAVLTHAAVRDRLTRIDRVELDDAGTFARAVQVNPLRDEAGFNRTTLPVGTQEASRQSLDWTSEQVRQLDEAIRVQQQEQFRFQPREEHDIDVAKGLQPFSHPDHPQHALYADVQQRFGAKGIELSEAQLSDITRQMHGTGYAPGWQGDVTVYNDKAVVGSFQIGSRMASIDMNTPAPSVQDTMQGFQTDQQDRAQPMESLHRQQATSREHGHGLG